MNTAPPQTTTVIFQPLEVGSGVIDLLQVYPSITNNLNFQTYKDNINESLFCVGCSIALTSAPEFMRGILVVMLIILCLGAVIICVELGSFDNSVWNVFYVFLIFALYFALVSGKAYLLYQCRNYLEYYRIRSLDFHEYGMKLYYGLFFDLTGSFLISFVWVILVAYHCIFEISSNCDSVTSFDSNISGTLSWLLCLPLFIYSILGMLFVFSTCFGPQINTIYTQILYFRSIYGL